MEKEVQSSCYTYLFIFYNLHLPSSNYETRRINISGSKSCLCQLQTFFMLILVNLDYKYLIPMFVVYFPFSVVCSLQSQSFEVYILFFYVYPCLCMHVYKSMYVYNCKSICMFVVTYSRLDIYVFLFTKLYILFFFVLPVDEIVVFSLYLPSATGCAKWKSY